MADELTRWKQQQAQDKIRAGDKYTDDGFIVTNEFGHYFEQKTFKDYYDRLLKDADIGHFTFHALRHTFATRALERGMDYKTLSAILGHYSVAFTIFMWNTLQIHYTFIPNPPRGRSPQRSEYLYFTTLKRHLQVF